MILALAVVVERRVAEPVVPPAIISKRTTLLAVIASLAVGIAMFGGSVFLGQYFQVARGYSPTEAGLLTMPLMLGVMVSSIVVGRMIVATGYYKRYIVGGVALLVVGFGLLGTIDHTTSLVLIGFYMVLVGAGVGASMQNLVLAVQNTVDSHEIGTASGVIAFFRSLGGAVGVTVLGAILSNHVTDLIAKGLTGIGVDASAMSGGSTLDVKNLPAPIAEVVRAAYGDGTARIFVVAAVVGVVGLIATVFIQEVALRKTVSMKPSEVGESATESPEAVTR